MKKSTVISCFPAATSGKLTGRLGREGERRMKKKIISWDDGLNFDFVKGCETGIVMWWNEKEICINTEKVDENE